MAFQNLKVLFNYTVVDMANFRQKILVIFQFKILIFK